MPKVSLASLLLLAASSIQLSYASGTQCFWKGGTQPPQGSNFQPCFPSDTETHCCDSDQTCLSNGLCLVKWDTSLNTGACTDTTWNSPSCFQGCDQFSTLYRCTGNQWCCSPGGNTTNCCNDPNVNTIKIEGQALIQNGSAFIPDYSLALTADITNNNASSSSSSPSTSTSSDSSDSSSGTLAAGLGAGLGVGIPFLIVIGVLTYLLMKSKKNVRDLQQKLDTAAANSYGSDSKGQHISEVHGYHKPRNELSSGNHPPLSELQS